MRSKSRESIEVWEVKFKLEKTLETIDYSSDSTDFGLEHAENLIAEKPPVFYMIDDPKNN